jgi:hypothetical protein
VKIYVKCRDEGLGFLLGKYALYETIDGVLFSTFFDENWKETWPQNPAWLWSEEEIRDHVKSGFFVEVKPSPLVENKFTREECLWGLVDKESFEVVVSDETKPPLVAKTKKQIKEISDSNKRIVKIKRTIIDEVVYE